jgi:hypothetical protein
MKEMTKERKTKPFILNKRIDKKKKSKYFKYLVKKKQFGEGPQKIPYAIP